METEPSTVVLLGCLVTTMFACGDPPTNDDGGVAGSGGLPVSFGAPIVHFLANGAAIYRLEDLNGDGDTNEADELTLAAAAGVSEFVAIDDSSVIAALGSSTPRLELFRDGDHNRIFDVGERSVWFDGAWPVAISSMNQIIRGPAGTIYVVSQLQPSHRQAIFKLLDGNGDGDANDTGEISAEADFTFSEFVGGMAVDATGAVWFVVNSGLYIVRDGTPHLMLDAASSGTLNLEFSLSSVGALPDGRVLFTQGGGFGRESALYGARDTNGDDTLAGTELERLWGSDDYGWYAVSGLDVLEDGSISTEIYRLVDADGDGRFTTPGETMNTHYLRFAEANGQLDPGLVYTRSSVLLAGGVAPRPPEGCIWIGGNWELRNTCSPINPRRCQVYQDGCHVEFECSGYTLVGDLSGNALDYHTGCSASIRGLEFEGHCAEPVECTMNFRHWSAIPPEERP